MRIVATSNGHKEVQLCDRSQISQIFAPAKSSLFWIPVTCSRNTVSEWHKFGHHAPQSNTMRHISNLDGGVSLAHFRIKVKVNICFTNKHSDLIGQSWPLHVPNSYVIINPSLLCCYMTHDWHIVHPKPPHAHHEKMAFSRRQIRSGVTRRTPVQYAAVSITHAYAQQFWL